MKPNASGLVLLAVLILSALGVSCGDNEETMPNQQIAEQLLTTIFNDRDPAALPSAATDDYVHHQLGVPSDADGAAAFYEQLLDGSPELNLDIRRSVSSENIVFVHAHLTTASDDIGNDRVGTAVVHVVELRDGLVAEQWVLTQEVPPTSANPNTMFDGPVPGEGDAAESLALGMRFFDEFFVGRDLESLNDFVRPSYIQHNPQIPDGIDAVQAFFAQTLAGFPGYTPRARRYAAEGDFVAVLYQAALSPDDNDATGIAIVDLWRTEGGEIVEHWDVLQFLDGTTPF